MRRNTCLFFVNVKSMRETKGKHAYLIPKGFAAEVGILKNWKISFSKG